MLEGGPSPGYQLSYFSEADALPEDVLVARLKAEASKVPRYAEGSAWRASLPSMRALHRWLNFEHGAYAAKRLVDARWHAPEESASLSASYRS